MLGVWGAPAFAAGFTLGGNVLGVRGAPTGVVCVGAAASVAVAVAVVI